MSTTESPTRRSNRARPNHPTDATPAQIADSPAAAPVAAASPAGLARPSGNCCRSSSSTGRCSSGWPCSASSARSRASPSRCSSAQVIDLVEAGETLGWLVWGARRPRHRERHHHAAIQHYLLQRTGDGRRALEPQAPRAADAAPADREFDTRRTGDLVSRVGTDTTLLYAVLTQGLVDALGGAVTVRRRAHRHAHHRPRAARPHGARRRRSRS